VKGGKRVKAPSLRFLTKTRGEKKDAKLFLKGDKIGARSELVNEAEGPPWGETAYAEKKKKVS